MKSRFQNRNNSNNSSNNSSNNACNSFMTTCNKGGIKIRDNKNEYKQNPFEGLDPFKNKEEVNFNLVNYQNNQYENLDLNIESYSRNDLFNLFGIKTMTLSDEIMRESKKIVLKTHPDKSKLEPKYFLFFSKAYKRLLSIYEFQNKSKNKVSQDKNEYYESTNGLILDKMFDINKDLKDSKNFNQWFNDQFEKQKLEESNDAGYGNWLKSDEDIVFTPNVNKNNMSAEIEKRKKEVQSLSVYKGVNESMSSTFGGSSLMEYNSNFTSGSLFSNDGMGYTDLRQAYVESVIPVTEDDYNKIQKYRNVDEYKRQRDLTNINPLDKEEAMKQLYMSNKQKDEESAALAFYYATQNEKIQKNQEQFWSSLKQLTNW